MKFFGNLRDLYISSSVHVAFAVVAFSILTSFEYGVQVDRKLLVFIFLGTVTGYNFVKYAGVAGLHHLSLTKNLRLIQIFSLFCFLLLLFYLFQQSFEVILVAGILGGLTVLYALPVFKGANLRSVNGLKVFVIATVWAGVTVLMPLVNSQGVELQDVIISFFQRLLIVVALMLPFEIRDLKFDEASLGTIPQRLGVEKTRILGVGLLITVCLVELLKSDLLLVNLLSLFIFSAITGIFIKASRVFQKKYFASFWVEALPIIWLGIWLVLSSFIG